MKAFTLISRAERQRATSGNTRRADGLVCDASGSSGTSHRQLSPANSGITGANYADVARLESDRPGADSTTPCPTHVTGHHLAAHADLFGDISP